MKCKVCQCFAGPSYARFTTVQTACYQDAALNVATTSTIATLDDYAAQGLIAQPAMMLLASLHAASPTGQIDISTCNGPLMQPVT